MSYHGNIALGDTIDVKFTTVNSSGVPTQLAGTPVISAYPGNSTTEITAGITLTVDFDTRTGLNNVRVVATSGNGYAAGNYSLVITTGTVGGSSVVGYVVGAFSIESRMGNLSATTETQIDDIETDVTAILADTNELQTDWVNGGRLDNILDARSSQASVDGLNNLSAAQVNAEVDTALVDIGLDHLVSAAVVGTDVTDNSIIARLVSSSATADWDTFVNTDDSLQAISESGGGGPTAAQIADAVWDEAASGHVGAGSFGEEVQSHSTSAEITALNDPTAGAIADAVWDEPRAGHVGAGSFGENVNLPAATETQIDNIEADTNELQTDWVNGGRLDLIIDATATDASNAAADASTASSRVTTALPNSAPGASGGLALYDDIFQLVNSGTVNDVSATTTSFVISSGFTANNDDYNSMVAVLELGAGRRIARLITDYVGATRTITISPALPAAPANGARIDILGYAG